MRDRGTEKMVLLRFTDQERQKISRISREFLNELAVAHAVMHFEKRKMDLDPKIKSTGVDRPSRPERNLCLNEPVQIKNVQSLLSLLVGIVNLGDNSNAIQKYHLKLVLTAFVWMNYFVELWIFGFESLTGTSECRRNVKVKLCLSEFTHGRLKFRVQLRKSQ